MNIITFLIFSLVSILVVALCDRILLKHSWKDIASEWKIYTLLLVLGPIGTGIVVGAFIFVLIKSLVQYNRGKKSKKS